MICVGWNIEIFLPAAVGGILILKGLPRDRDMKIMGIPDRVSIQVFRAVFAVMIEVILNRTGIFV